ncbi:hypothetical protein FBY22_7539 [Streptomyces sp. SLBN-31]|nr:hypothetical protein FBY22_7539 [Streptomyces sp. SLBN-31]
MLPHRGDRRDLRGPAAGQPGRQHGDDDADHEGARDRARRDDQRPVRDGWAPRVPISERRPAPMPMPATRPVTPATVPTTNASIKHRRVTWRREAPTARISASSRVRWATSMVKVLAMMNVPTKSAMPRRPAGPASARSSRTRSARPGRRRASGRWWSPPAPCPSALSSPAFSAGLGGAGGGLHVDLVVRAGLAEQLLGGGVSNRARLPPAGDVAVVGGEDAADRRGEDRAVDGEADRVADLVPGAFGRLRVDGDLVRAVRSAAALSGYGRPCRPSSCRPATGSRRR